MRDFPMTFDAEQTELVDEFLKDGGYSSIDDWMKDSDYEFVDNNWWYNSTLVDANECIWDAMDACGFLEEKNV
jgi:hypothetical protein